VTGQEIDTVSVRSNACHGLDEIGRHRAYGAVARARIGLASAVPAEVDCDHVESSVGEPRPDVRPEVQS
jgi:hypothetical protein